MKRTALLMTVLIFVFSASSCSKKTEYNKSDFFAMNTYTTLTADCPDEILSLAKKEVYAIENQLSASVPESDINNLSDPTSETYQTTMNLLKKAYSISDTTDGAFDFTLGALIDLWNVNGISPQVPDDSKIARSLSHCGFEKTDVSGEVFVSSDIELKVDLGAIAKGYAGQAVAELFKNHGVTDASIYLGGNVTVIGSSPANRDKGKEGWNVAVNNPFGTADIIGVMALCDKTVSVSGSYERFFEQNGVIYHHILDRSTGYPAKSDLASVAVISDDGALADALSTALFVMGYENAMSFYDSGVYAFEAVFCTNDGRVFVTDGLIESFVPNYDAKDADSSLLLFPDYD